ncbi:MAG TPA: hypothetical protein ENJ22_01475 [Gammaproteobacteria bacterium]|nr:hypothetical protein [Gammaproteobacteria bacterium]
MTTASRIVFATFLLLEAAVLRAAQIQFINVDIVGDRYFIRAESLIKVPPWVVRDSLLDYDHFHLLSEDFSTTRYLPPAADGTPLAYSQLEGCILIFCAVVEKVERILTPSENEILAIALPERSDFLYSHTRWVIKPAGPYTRLYFELEMEPDFWIPPLIGGWAIRSRLRHTAVELSGRIERLWRDGMALPELAAGQEGSARED